MAQIKVVWDEAQHLLQEAHSCYGQGTDRPDLRVIIQCQQADGYEEEESNEQILFEEKKNVIQTLDVSISCS